MSARVIFENVAGVGDLFADKKVFVCQRVPRGPSYWKELVQNNGGETVKLDKLADIVIADHARKDCPRNSISWTWLEASVKTGKLADIEAHRAGLVERVREIGSIQPRKAGRTPFTEEDDHFLLNMVIKAERNGASIKGNELYKQIERQNPRHTYQSWRDRWIKTLSIGPRPKIRPDAEDISKPKVDFTEADDEILRTNYEFIMDVDKEQADAAWRDFAQQPEYNHHGPVEWANRFETRIRSEIEAPESAERRVFSTSSQQSDSRPKANSSRKATSKADGRACSKGNGTQSFSRDTPQLGDALTKNDEEASFQMGWKKFVVWVKESDPAFEMEPIYAPKICGRKVRLYELWKVVSQSFGGYDTVTESNLWPEVARELSLKDLKASDELKALYEDQLLHEFEDWLEDAMIDDQLRETIDPEDQRLSNGRDFVLSSPQPASSNGIKRRRNMADGEIELPTNASSPNKRQRAEIWKGNVPEIPTTPEEVLKGNKDKPHAFVDHIDDEECDVTPCRTSRPVSSQTRGGKHGHASEPQTQDFRWSGPDDPYDASTQAVDGFQDDPEVARVFAEYITEGYTPNIIVEALEATTMETGDLEAVMNSIRNGDGIPCNIQGVWTAKDDKALDEIESKEYRRIMAKHGSERVMMRQRFKQDAEEIS